MTPGTEHCLICHADLGWPEASRPAEVSHRAARAELEAAACPRGHGALSHRDLGGGHVHVCAACAGVFVERGSLDAVLSPGVLRESLLQVASGLDSARTEEVDGSRVGYLKCPACAASMARRNFERVSGVMVDACHPHGTWFDGGELVRASAFLDGGGLERKAQFEERQADLNRRDREKLEAIERKILARERGRKF